MTTQSFSSFELGDIQLYTKEAQKEKLVGVVLNCRAILIQTYIKAPRHQTSLLQS